MRLGQEVTGALSPFPPPRGWQRWGGWAARMAGTGSRHLGPTKTRTWERAFPRSLPCARQSSATGSASPRTCPSPLTSRAATCTSSPARSGCSLLSSLVVVKQGLLVSWCGPLPSSLGVVTCTSNPAREAASAIACSHPARGGQYLNEIKRNFNLKLRGNGDTWNLDGCLLEFGNCDENAAKTWGAPKQVPPLLPALPCSLLALLSFGDCAVLLGTPRVAGEGP